MQPWASGVAAGFEGDFDLALGEQRAGDGGAEEVLVLVDGAGADHAPEVFGDELFAHVGDVTFGGSGLFGLVLEAFELISALADIAADGDHFAAIVFLEPGDDDRGVQTARVGECDFFRVCHDDFLLSVVRLTCGAVDEHEQQCFLRVEAVFGLIEDDRGL